jgi:hypothetical protein
VEEIRKDLGPLEASLAALPKVSVADLKNLQKLEAACSTADAALQAMATGIELVTGAADIDGSPLPAGAARVLSKTTELRVGDTVLRIHPGGGNRLADARQALRQAIDSRQKGLDVLGLESAAMAQQVFEQREVLDRKIDGLRSRIETTAPDTIARDIATVESSLTTLLADIARREPALAGFVPPDTPQQASSMLAAAHESADDAEARESSAKTALGTLQTCTPSDYAALGARQHFLAPPPRHTHHAPPLQL